MPAEHNNLYWWVHGTVEKIMFAVVGSVVGDQVKKVFENIELKSTSRYDGHKLKCLQNSVRQWNGKICKDSQSFSYYSLFKFVTKIKS